MFVWNIYETTFTLDEEATVRRNIITSVNFIVSKADTEDSSKSVYEYGTVNLSSPGDSFTLYDDLTEETLVAWTKAALGDDKIIAIETRLTAALEELVNPTVGYGVPWSIFSE